MGTINLKAKNKTKSHLNWMGGNSFDIKNPITQLRVMASSCFFGEPQYYHDSGVKPKKLGNYGKKCALSQKQLDHLRKTLDAIDPQEWRGLAPAEMMERAIDAALDFNVEETLKEAVRLRQEEHIRTTPQVILVRAANHKDAKKTGLIKKYASEIIRRADEPAVQLAYQLAAYGEKSPIPNSLKRAWRLVISTFSEFQLSKYRMENRQVKTVDVVNLCHPKSEAVDKLCKGELKLGQDQETWESLISREGSNKESWTKAVESMGHMALLRNLRNLITNSVDKELYLEKLIEGAKTGQQLPFRYFSAYKAIENNATGAHLDAIESAMQTSLGNLPYFAGKTMSLCDNSGSAWGSTTSSLGTMHIAEIANLTAILTGLASEDGYIGIFGDRLQEKPVRKKSSIFDLLKEACKIGHGIGGGTEHGIWLFWDNAIKKKIHWDNVFVYSDMQAGHGGLYGTGGYPDYLFPGTTAAHIDVPKLVNKYRSEVNPNVNVFLVQVAGYKDTIMPEFYKRTYILGGWGEGLLKFAKSMIELPSQ